MVYSVFEAIFLAVFLVQLFVCAPAYWSNAVAAVSRVQRH